MGENYLKFIFVSLRGKEFRNSFEKLGCLTSFFPDVPHLALTATTTKSDMTRYTEVLQYRNTIALHQSIQSKVFGM